MAAAGLVVDFSKGTQNVRASVVDIELTNDDTGQCGIRIGANSNDAVRDASQEQIAALASDVSTGDNKPARQFLLHRDVVLIDPLGNFVIRRVGAWSKRSIVRIRDEVGSHCGYIDRITSAVDNRVDQVAFDRLQQVLGLSRAVENSE